MNPLHPVLFLDVDGVLNTRTYLYEQKLKLDMPDALPAPPFSHRIDFEMDPARVAVLNRIFDAVPNLQLVYSTFWRGIDKVGEAGITRALDSHGFRYTERCIGITPTRKTEDGRPQEIANWFVDNPTFSGWAIVVDDCQGIAAFAVRSDRPFFPVVTSMDAGGLTDAHVDRLLEDIKALLP